MRHRRPPPEDCLTLVEISHLDTAHFGIRSAKAAAVTVDTLPRLQEFCRCEGVEFLIARCDATDLVTARAMCAAGFQLMDTLVYVDGALQEPLPRTPTAVVMRRARADDLPRVIAIATECFRDYLGHYHADPRLDRRKCDGVYVSWAKRACTREDADEAFVGEIDGRIVGFITVRGGEVATATLAGVCSEYRRQGVYRALVEEALRWGLANGSSRMQISTQLANRVSLNTWIQAGFRHSRASYTFHRWFAPVADEPSPGLEVDRRADHVAEARPLADRATLP